MPAPANRFVDRSELETTDPIFCASGCNRSMNTSTVLPVPIPTDMPSLMYDNAAVAA
jgi:hypothetical protein